MMYVIKHLVREDTLIYSWLIRSMGNKKVLPSKTNFVIVFSN